ncbi:MAG: GDP-mannose 4,6-dehydratase [Planctomycetes bacterium]|nr:GDP-mannose 4,6-dehydratase [Planctomycetota bacterium]
MARIVITGGAGFIGSHLVDAFLARGDRVVAVDNLLTGNRQNLAAHEGRSGFEFVQRDVCQGVFLTGPVDAVLHFASPASPRDYLELPIQTLKVGALGTHAALGLARAKGARFLLASTSEVYGDPEVHPQKESYWGNVNPVGPRGVYDEAKRFAEAMTMAYHRVHGIDTRIVRIFNTYGPRMRLQDGRALPEFLSQALTGAPLTVHGDGAQTRSFCYVGDTVAGILAVLERAGADPVNVGAPGEISILELARKVIAATGSPSSVVHVASMVDDPRRREPDLTRARALGWGPTTKLDDGLARTVAWFREALAARAGRS